MTKRMLIDATHAEETRVAVVDDGRLEEFDYESAFRKPLKGNIFLAKVTRVEPSLQAAFVNFGGNRHGFLPFSEIHPDYFRIPVADREALIAEQEAAIREAEAEEEAQAAEDAKIAAQQEARAQGRSEGREDGEGSEGSAVMIEEIDDDKDAIEEIGGERNNENEEEGDEHSSASEESSESEEEGSEGDEPQGDGKRRRRPRRRSKSKALAMEADVKVSDAQPESDELSDDEDNIGNVRQPGDNHYLGDNEEHEHDHEHGDDEDESVGNVEGGNSENQNGQNGERGNRERGGRERGGRYRRGRGGRGGRGGDRGDRGGRGGRGGSGDGQRVERVGGDEIDHEQRFRFNLRRKYKIQEVIKRGQIMLVQVSKEERGNKGAAVGSYLSLPGRYCVLMPNSPRAGGVSRKIANYQDRARMREIMKDLEVPKGMSVILRTAGVSRTKVEIKRDLDYLMKLWDNIRELTLESTAPALVYEEADLVKRAVRDLYSRDIEEIHVSGEEGYNTAKNFMKMLMPSHVKKVVEYKNSTVPLFNHYKIEKQIAEIGESQVTLPSGGYLVINPTEALVSIDVNSGKATKERHIEETALRTNMEAAEEVARQLRLRDLGGLVVIDFIDMEDRRNNAKVERKMRESLSTDRARIQIGRISSFGLMELSRQRLSPSLTESQFELCQHCHGVGRVRTADAASIMVLRAIEDEGIKARASQVIAHVSGAVALYILNNKRQNLADIEARYNLSVVIRADENLGPAGHRVEVSKPISRGGDAEDDGDEDEGEEDNNNHRSRHQHQRPQRAPQQQQSAPADGEEETSSDDDKPPRDEAGGRNRRRGRRGGRRRGGRDREGQNGGERSGNRDSQPHAQSQDESEDFGGDDYQEQASVIEASVEVEAANEDAKPKRSRKASAKREESEVSVDAVEEKTEVRAVKISNDDKPERPAPAPRDYESVNEAPGEKKKGWWNKLVE